MDSGQAAGSVLFTRDWNDNSVANQTAYGALSPTQSASGGQFHLKAGGAATAASSLDISPSITDFTAQINVSAYSAERSGLIYRTLKSYFVANPTTNWGFRHWAAVKATTVSFGYGSATLQEVTFGTPYTSGTIVLLKVVVSGTLHKIYVDGTLYITYNDSTNGAAAGIFGMMSILTANDSLFDNLVITT